MKNNMTELVFILDRSGSMAGLESDTIGGFNAMIEKQKSQDGACYVSTVLFDNECEVLHDRVPLRDVPKMTDRDYTVRGCTALIDAIGGAIHHIGNVHKYARPEDVPAHTMFVITTDGQENASRRYTSDQVKRMIGYLGSTVTYLKRTEYAFLNIEDLAVGEYRELTAEEISELKGETEK